MDDGEEVSESLTLSCGSDRHQILVDHADRNRLHLYGFGLHEPQLLQILH